MLEKIKEIVFSKYSKTDIKGLFISVFDEKNDMLMSNGVAYTDKPLEQLIETLFHWLVEKHNNIGHIIVDIVTDIQKIIDLNEIPNISLQEYGLILSTKDKSGILLPDTKWIINISQALKTIKEKNWLDWNAQITKFKTDRFSVI